VASAVEVAHFEAALVVSASVPHERTPVADALTSHAAAFRPETMRLVVEAVVAVMAVVEANAAVR